MGKSAPSLPTPPDPTVVSTQQASGDISTAIANRSMNNTNQVTPWGNLNYNQSGTQKITLPDGTTRDIPTYTATQTLTPTGQKTVEQQQLAQYGLAQIANQQAGRVGEVLGTKLNFDGQPQMVTGLDTSKITELPTGVDASGFAPLPTSTDMSAVNAVGGVNGRIDTRGAQGLPTGLDASGLPTQISSLDTGTLSAMPGSPQAVNQQVSDAMFGQAKSRLDPQWQQQQQQLEAKLTQQGIPVGSQAYTTAMDNFSRAKNDAYTSAQNAATVSGAAQGATDYGLALQGRQQGIGEQTTNAGLAAQAAQLGMTAQQLNAAIGNQSAQTSVGAQAANSQSQLAQKVAAAQLSLQGQQLSGNQALAANQFGLQTQGQDAAMAGAAASQQTQQQMLAAQLAQTARQQGISEQQYLYNLPLNQTSALLSGSQVQGPSFVGTPQTNMSSPNMLGAYALQQQGQQANYQAQMASNSAGLGGLFGLAGAGLSAGLSGGTGGSAASLIGSMFSSREYKIDKAPLNRLEVLQKINRLPVERWKYKPDIADGAEHIGPYAEDFAQQFGGDGKTIDFISIIGILTISVQALTDKIGSQQDLIMDLMGRIQNLEAKHAG